MSTDSKFSPRSDGFEPLALQRLLERFPRGLTATFAVSESELVRLSESSVALLEPLRVTIAFDGKATLTLDFEARLRVDCIRCLKPLDEQRVFSPEILLFEMAADADQAMLADPELDAVSTQDNRTLIELIEDEILLELGLGLTHADCTPGQTSDRERPSPFQDLARLMSMKKPQ